jgi:hypothetical protein
MAEPEAAATEAPRARTTVATYGTYGEAERAVDFLSDSGFPVDRAAIVGTGLRTVEQISGRITTGRAALMGAGQGVLIGLLFAALFGIFFTLDRAFFGLLVYAVVLGALLGAAFGGIGQAALGGRRDFASVTGMQAERYELQVDHEVAARARELLADLPSGSAAR